MPRNAIDDLAIARLEEERGRGERFVPMRVDLCLYDVEGDGRAARWGKLREVLSTVGGKWDRKLDTYVVPANDLDDSLILRCHDGQAETARWFAAWLKAYLEGQPMLAENGDPIYEVLASSGRRAGKTDFWVGKAPVTFAIAAPGSIVWIVVPDMTETDEVVRAIEDHLPRGWYTRTKEPDFVYELRNGSKIFLRSSRRAEDLKQGRADLVVINEAQKQSEAAWAVLSGAIVDRGGLLVMTCNPPSDAKGSWLYDWREKVIAGAFTARTFYLDNELNPFVSKAALSALYRKLAAIDKRLADIEVRGLWLPPPNVVWHAFSVAHNVAPLPAFGIITRDLLQRRANLAADNLIGFDFQKTPHMAAAAWRIARDPAPEGAWPHEHVLLYLVRVWRIENANEDQLLDVLEADGFTAENSLAIADASGDWQTGAHDVKGKGSFDVFRRRRWRVLPPDPKQKRNPPIEERVLVGNTLWCSGTGKRRAFVVPCPENEAALETLRKHELRNGRPSKHSDFGHLSDAISYPEYWLFPRMRRKEPGRVEAVATDRGLREDEATFLRDRPLDF